MNLGDKITNETIKVYDFIMTDYPTMHIVKDIVTNTKKTKRDKITELKDTIKTIYRVRGACDYEQLYRMIEGTHPVIKERKSKS